MKIKAGDKVKILTGKDKGKTGKVLQVLVEEKKIVIEGLNLMIKHQRAKRQGEKGQRIQFPAPLDVSNVALICTKCGRPTRVGFKLTKVEAAPDNNNQKIIKSRVCQKCKEVI
ncbi:MAG: 50S ribosomal protein L24 [Patescibacteria group bacterium]